MDLTQPEKKQLVRKKKKGRSKQGLKRRKGGHWGGKNCAELRTFQLKKEENPARDTLFGLRFSGREKKRRAHRRRHRDNPVKKGL